MASSSRSKVNQTDEHVKLANTLSNLALMGDEKRLRQQATRQNVNRRDQWGQTPLLRAAWGGESGPKSSHSDCVRLLLSLGADKNVRDPQALTPLHWAAESNNLAVLRLLANASANLEAREKQLGCTPLMLACWKGKLEAASELLQLGSDPGALDIDGDTAESLAEMHEHWDIVQLLRNWSTAKRGFKTDNLDSDDDFSEEEIGGAEDLAEPVPRSKSFIRQISSVELNPPPMTREPTKLLMRSQTMTSIRYYPVRDPQGHCVIINIEIYDKESQFSNRTGSELDVMRVEKLFESLRFKVTVRRNLTGKEIFWELSKIAQLNHSRYGTLVCFLMAHGTNGAIYGRDGQFQMIKELTMLFQPSKCYGLDRKPKLFFLQACRGSVEQVAVRSHLEAERASSVCIQRDGDVPVKDASFIPNESDFLICFANTEDSPAYRSPDRGSIFIQTLCDVIESRYENEDLEGMILAVNEGITSQAIPGKKEGKKHVFYHSVVDRQSRLTKRVSLNPDEAL